ncbi:MULTISPECIES: VOC family protein [unclassified Crossiella]|uniref:VOC family protein n=1 Tax=unclassified Crossiella TaxID=2620835 RepID=UPI001FFE878E|nr:MULTISPECIES: VOC family protein [unclassified Crossiella]MCK2238759.1 VOC family protein [Crossiella sp. S99.2]MCK2251671.1 VOC family protein [Crossiella sp. S99.1]
MRPLGVLQCLVLHCPAPRRLAAFYQELLGGEVNRPDRRWAVNADWSTLHLPDGRVLCFQRQPGHRRPVWGDERRPQLAHLDIDVADLAAAHERVLELGATLLDSALGRGWQVYADPAGHPFCLLGH